ncbi:unnamed protein product [Chrysoparadoxa australica]
MASYSIAENQESISSEPEIDNDGIEEKVIELLKSGSFDSKSIVEKLKIEWPSGKVTSYLKKHKEIETLKGKPLKFTHKDRTSGNQVTLF